ncbi:MAG: hypothetical protein ACK50A_05850 [Sphingobacteriaceae bacterium]
MNQLPLTWGRSVIGDGSISQSQFKACFAEYNFHLSLLKNISIFKQTLKGKVRDGFESPTTLAPCTLAASLMTRNKTIILIIFCFYFGHGQKNSSTRKSVKYPLGYSTTIHIDSNGVFLYYTVDYQNFVTRNIDRKDSIDKAVFDNRILLTDLLNAINGHIHSIQKTKTTSSGQIYYYYAPEDKYNPHQIQTCNIKHVTFKKTSRRNFIMTIQVETNQDSEYFEFKYQTKKSLKKYPNLTDKFNNSKTLYRKHIESE